jgi:hypothetical protein
MRMVNTPIFGTEEVSLAIMYARGRGLPKKPRLAHKLF